MTSNGAISTCAKILPLLVSCWSAASLVGCRRQEQASATTKPGANLGVSTQKLDVRAPLSTVASVVLGQDRLNQTSGNRMKPNSLANPESVALDFTTTPPRIWVADTNNNRILGWKNALAWANGAAPDLLIGQWADGLSNNAHGQDFIFQPASYPQAANNVNVTRVGGIAVDALGDLYVADTEKHRVLTFINPFVTDTVADRVYGQASYSTRSCNQLLHDPTALTMCHPFAISFDSAGNMYVADSDNSRILRFNAPLTDTTPDAVLGQPDFTKGGRYQPLTDGDSLISDKPRAQANTVGAQGLNWPTSVAVDRSVTPNRLWVADTFNNRVVGYSSSDFTGSDAATRVIGQPNATSNTMLCWQAPAPARTASTLCNPWGVAVDAAGNLYVADTAAHRVLGYQNPWAGVPGDTVADKVWGQGASGTAFGASGMAAATSTSVNRPAGVFVSAAGALYVADTDNNRVLVFQGAMSGDTTADIVFGQPNFTSSTCNTGGISANSLCRPRAITEDAAGNVYIVDGGANRVLIYRASDADQTADFVLGQPSFNQGGCNTSGVATERANVVVANVYNTQSWIVQGVSQPDASRLCEPLGIAITPDNTVWVGDSNNGRVVGFTSPMTTDTTADFVLGRPDFARTPCSLASATCYNLKPVEDLAFLCRDTEMRMMPDLFFPQNHPIGLAIDGNGALYVSVSTQNRVLRYDSPTTSPAADRVLGQPNMASEQPNWPGAASMHRPLGLYVDQSSTPNRLIVGDTRNNRLLVFNDPAHAANGQAADIVVAQPDANSSIENFGGLSASSLNAPHGIGGDATGNIYVADTGNNRVLKFNTPFTTDWVADGVIGQTSMTSGQCNKGQPMATASTLCDPTNLVVSGSNVWIADAHNHRVLRYDSVMTTDLVADAVLGQTDFIKRHYNMMGGDGFITPESVAVDRSKTPNRLYVADRFNHRILGWSNAESLAAGQSADIVIGQPDMFQATCNNGGVSATSLCEPQYVRADSKGRLWVADGQNHRVLRFDDPFGTDTVADFVLGQTDFSGHLPNAGANVASATSLRAPRGLDIDPNGNVWVADAANNRVLLFLDPSTTDRVADRVFGQSTMSGWACNGNGDPNGQTANTLCMPQAVRIDYSVTPYSVYIADTGLDRILRFDDAIAGDTIPDGLIGQPSYTSPRFPMIAPTLVMMREPAEIAVDFEGSVYGSDESADQVRVFKTPRTTDASADRLFGQIAFNRGACNISGQVSSGTMCKARGIDFDSYGGLWIADRQNQRVIGFPANSRPTATSLAVTPIGAKTSDILVATYVYSDSESDPQGATVVKWYKDGVEQPAYANQLTIPASATAKGQAWHFTVLPTDGIQPGHLVTSPTLVIQNTLPVTTVDLQPTAPKTADVLTLTYTFADADADTDQGTDIRWLKNNVEETALHNQLTVPASATSRFDLWQAIVTPNDGQNAGVAVETSIIAIANTAPVATNALISPAAPRAANNLSAVWVYADADSDSQTPPEIIWYKNGVQQPSYNNLTRVLAPLTAGDIWTFTLRPRDGTDYGTLIASAPVTVASTPPTASALQIVPSNPRTADVLTATYLYNDVDSQGESNSEIKWYRNGVEVTAFAGQLTVPASQTSRDESWYFTIRPNDGAAFGTLQTSPTVVIDNTAPIASAITITPALPKTTDPLVLAFSYGDADGDAQGTPQVRWFKNGIEQSAFANLQALPASATTKRDVWFCRVRPHDGTNLGVEQNSPSAFIANTAPVADAGPDQNVNATSTTVTRVSLVGTATTDADDDLVSYTWTLAGTQIATGTSPQVDLPIGTHTVTLTASDGEATHSDTVVVTVVNAKPTATAPESFSAPPGEVVLNGSGADSLGRVVSFAWSQVSGPPVNLINADQAQASFFALQAGVRVFQLVTSVEDGTLLGEASTVTVTTQDVAPVAQVPTRFVVSVGQVAEISQFGSSDPNGEPLTYQWSVSPSNAASLSDATLSTVRVNALQDGTFDLSLKVSDGTLTSTPAVLKLIAVDTNVRHAPVAVAWAPVVASVGAPVTLDGSASYDGDGQRLRYTWAQVSGPTAALSSTSSAKPTFTASGAGTCVFRLTVADADSATGEATVSVEVADTSKNGRPVARIEPISTVQVESRVTLDASRSIDPDGAALTYQWTQLDGVPVTLTSSTSAAPSFIALRPGALSFKLVVSDGTLSSEPVTQSVRVVSAGNDAPIASAGGDQKLIVQSAVTLDAEGSTDAQNDSLRYVWEQMYGTPVVLSTTGPKAVFTARGGGLHRFRLTVWDGEAPSAFDEVDVHVQTHGADNSKPIAVVTGPGTGKVGEVIMLDGAKSHDDDPLDQLMYKWSIVGFPSSHEPTLETPHSASSAFVAHAPGTYAVSLVVEDGELASAPSFILIVVTDESGSSSARGCQSSGGMLSMAQLLLVLTLRCKRRHTKSKGEPLTYRTLLSVLCVLSVALHGCRRTDSAKGTPGAERASSTQKLVREPRDKFADVVLGQAHLNAAAVNGTDAQSMYSPRKIALDTSVNPPRLYVADTLNNRVLGWSNANAFANGAPANLFIGTPTAEASQGVGYMSELLQLTTCGGASGTLLCNPQGVAVNSSGDLFVADTKFNRVVRFNQPFTTDKSADDVYGQATLSGLACNQGAGPGAQTLCAPNAVAFDSAGNLYVSDSGNNRVLKFLRDAVTNVTDFTADFVAGQTSLSANAPNIVDMQGLSGPGRVAIDRSVTPHRLWVADTDNNRVLGFPADPVSGAVLGTATIVLGQTTSTNTCNNGGRSASSLCAPMGVAVDASGNVYVADSKNNRVLRYNTPLTSDAIADQSYGQSGGFTTAACAASPTSMCNPQGVAITPDGSLVVADTKNHRVLRFDNAAAGDSDADAVYGQPSLDTAVCNNGGRSATTLCTPVDVAVDALNNLWVADHYNNRLLEYDPGDATADRVIGQGSSMLVGVCNSYGENGSQTGINASTICGPSSVSVADDGTLWVGDGRNGRVLGYATPLTSDVATTVLGQPDFSGTRCHLTNANCFEANGFVDITGVRQDWVASGLAHPNLWERTAVYRPPIDFNIGVSGGPSGRLYVAVGVQNRVLRFTSPIDYGAADQVIGQPNVASAAANRPENRSLSGPEDIFVDSADRLIVADTLNNRLMVWPATFTNGQAASAVIGQSNVASSAAGTTATTFWRPSALTGDSAGNIYVADTENGRVLKFNTPFTTDWTADIVFGQSTLTASGCNAGQLQPSSTRLCKPSGLAIAANGSKLWVSERGNNRVVRIDGPAANQQPANGVLGQLDLDHGGINIVSGSSFSEPSGLAIDRTVSPHRLYVADRFNHRILGWSNMDGLANNQPADIVIGQPDFLQNFCNNGGLSASSLCQPMGLRVDSGGRLWVSDSGNSRVLVFDNPFTGDKVADHVLGQADYTSGATNRGLGAPTASTLKYPKGLDVDSNGSAWIADTGNNRILYFNTPLISDTAADKVLGQTTMSGWKCNGEGDKPTFTLMPEGSGERFTPEPTASTLCEPTSARIDTRVTPYSVWVTDGQNYRVLRFDNATGGDAMPDQVLGQKGSYTSAMFPEEMAAYSHKEPEDLAFDYKGSLYVSQYSGNRVLVLDGPRGDDAGELAFGQQGLIREFPNASATPNALGLLHPVAIDFDEYGGLWVADAGNCRIVAFHANTLPVVSALAITPATPRTDDDLVAGFSYADSDGDAAAAHVIRWLKDGVEQPALRGLLTVPAEQTSKGENWNFTIAPNDGTQVGAAVTSPTIVIANTAPQSSNLVVSPANPVTSQDLTLSYSWFDADPVDVNTGTQIRWFKNNVRQEALDDQTTVPASFTSKSDVWRVTVAPSDGIVLGSTTTSASTQIANTAPTAGSPAIFPASLVASSNITATWTYADVDDDAQTAPEIIWYRNGIEQIAWRDQATVTGPLTGGDTWSFALRPHDGGAYGAQVVSGSVTVASTAPEASALRISPSSPLTADTLTANYVYTDADSQPEANSQIRWYRNGTEVAALADSLTVPPAQTSAGESWYFTVRPSDGLWLGALRTSSPVFIANTPPTASSAVIGPSLPKTTDVLTASYQYADGDGDAQGASEIRWFKNGLEMAAHFNQTTIPAVATTKKDVWFFRIKPRDASGFGEEEPSSPVQIQNTPPVANAGPDQTLTPTDVTTRVTLNGSGSSDVDSDLLVYTWSKNGTALATGVDAQVDLPLGSSTLTLSVTDGTDTHTDTVVINCGDRQPTAVAPADFSAPPGIVDLVATGTDPLSRTLTYQWTQTAGAEVTLVNADKASASFFALEAGTRTFQVVATAADSAAPSNPSSVTVTTTNVAPVAKLPARAVVAVSSPLVLETFGSSDPNGGTLTYQWSVVSGPTGHALDSAATAAATFTATQDGAYVVQLVVSDGVLSSAPALMSVLAVDASVEHAPVASATATTVGDVAATISLDGSASYDLDGQALTYAWRQVSGPTASLAKADAAVASFVPSTAGVHVFGVAVSDGKQSSAEVTVSIDVADTRTNQRPVARIDAVNARVGNSVKLNGSRSNDPDGSTLTYSWSQVDGVPVTLAGATTATPLFAALRPGVLTFQLVVSDGVLASEPLMQTVIVATASSAPVADAGADKKQLVATKVTLDASASTQADGHSLRYAWEQILGTPVPLTASGSDLSFVSKGVNRHRFRLVVWDQETPSAADEVDVLVQTHGAINSRPVAKVTVTDRTRIGTATTLDASESSDEDPLDVLTYSWSIVGFPTGGEARLDGTKGTTATFTPTAVGTYTVSLVVSDGDLKSSPVFINIFADRADSDKRSGGCQTGAGSALPMLALGVGVILRRSRRSRRG